MLDVLRVSTHDVLPLCSGGARLFEVSACCGGLTDATLGEVAQYMRLLAAMAGGKMEEAEAEAVAAGQAAADAALADAFGSAEGAADVPNLARGSPAQLAAGAAALAPAAQGHHLLGGDLFEYKLICRLLGTSCMAWLGAFPACHSLLCIKACAVSCRGQKDDQLVFSLPPASGDVCGRAARGWRERCLLHLAVVTHSQSDH